MLVVVVLERLVMPVVVPVAVLPTMRPKKAPVAVMVPVVMIVPVPVVLPVAVLVLVAVLVRMTRMQERVLLPSSLMS